MRATSPIRRLLTPAMLVVAGALVIIAGVRFASLHPSTELEDLRLEADPPMVVYDDALRLIPNGVDAVDVEVNGSGAQRTHTKSGGTEVWVALPDTRRYDIRLTGLVEGEFGLLSPNSAREFSVLRQVDPPTAPVVFAVRRSAVPDVVIIAGTADPCATIVVDGGRIEPWVMDASLACPNIYAGEDRFTTVSDTGRFEVAVRFDAVPNPEITLSAVNAQGTRSEPSSPLAREEADEFEPDGDHAEERAATNVLFALGPRDAIVTYSIVADAARPEIVDHLEGRTSPERTLDRLIGQFTIDPLIDRTGCPGAWFPAPLESTIEAGETVDLTITQQLPDVVSILNGLDARPTLTFCFSRGMPAGSELGKFDVSIRGYRVVSTTPAPSQVVASDAPTYSWTALEPDEPVTIQLERDALSILGLVPQFSIFQVAGTSQALLWVLDFLATFAIALPLIAVAWLLEKWPLFKSDAGRSAARRIVIVGAALIILPFVERLDSGLSIGPVEQFAQDALRSGFASGIVDPARIGEGSPILSALVLRTLGMVVVGIGWLAARYARSALATSLVQVAAVAWGLAIADALVAGGVRLLAGSNWTAVDFAAAAGVFSWILVAASILYAAWALARIATVRIRSIRSAAAAALIVVFAFHLAFPRASVYQVFGGYPPDAYRNGVDSIFPLLSYGYTIVIALAVALLMVRTWGRTGWATIALGARSEGRRAPVPPRQAEARRWVPTSGVLGSERTYLWLGALIFAGLVVGNAGLLFGLLPASFLAALAVYRYGLILPAAKSRALAEQAAELRRTRPSEIQAHLGRVAEGGGGAGDGGSPTRPPASPETPLMAIGPFRSIRGNARLGVIVAAAQAIVLVPLSIPQLGPLYGEDPYLWARVLVILAVNLVRWLLVGFFFGAFYEYLRGSTGIRKALWCGLAVAGIIFPFDVLSAMARDLPLWTVPYEAILTLTFFAVLGASFDFRVLMTADRARNPFEGLRNALTLSGLRESAARGAALLSPVGLTVVALMQSQIGQVVTSLLMPLLPIPVTASP